MTNAELKIKVHEFYALTKAQKASRGQNSNKARDDKRRKELAGEIRVYMLHRMAEAIRIGTTEAILLTKSERKEPIDDATIMERATEVLEKRKVANAADIAAAIVHAIAVSRKSKTTYNVRVGKAPKHLISLAKGGDPSENDDEEEEQEEEQEEEGMQE